MNDQAQLIGIVLIFLGVLDPILAVFLVGPRIPDPAKRRIVILALTLSGLLLLGVGVAVLTRLLPLP